MEETKAYLEEQVKALFEAESKPKGEDIRWPHSEKKKDYNDYETVNGKKYFRFSGKGDEIHLHGDKGALCGKPGLSNNYAAYKPHTPICPKCKAIAMKK